MGKTEFPRGDEDVFGGGRQGFIASLLRRNSLRFACVAMPVARFPGAIGLLPPRGEQGAPKESRLYSTFYRSLHYMHGEDHGTVTLTAKVRALAFKGSGSLRGKNDIRRLPLVKLLDPHVQLLDD
jgi:hypothetical protein